MGSLRAYVPTFLGGLVGGLVGVVCLVHWKRSCCTTSSATWPGYQAAKHQGTELLRQFLEDRPSLYNEIYGTLGVGWRHLACQLQRSTKFPYFTLSIILRIEYRHNTPEESAREFLDHYLGLEDSTVDNFCEALASIGYGVLASKLRNYPSGNLNARTAPQ